MSLRGKNLGPEGCATFTSTLAKNDTVESLNLADNQLGVSGMDLNGPTFCLEFSDALSRNTTLTSVDLSGNFLRDAGAAALSDGLGLNKTIRMLCLAGNAIGSQGGEAIGEAMKSNTSITSLDLKDNKIKCDGAYAMAKALDINSSLRELNMSNNEICSKDNATGCLDAVEFLAEVLTRHNQSLEVLHLRENDLGEDAAFSCADMLRFPTGGLREVDFSKNPFGDAVCEFAKSMVTSPLCKLSLSAVNAGDEAGEAFAEALQSNPTLVSLDLSSNSFGPQTAERMAQVLKDNNTTLQVLDLGSNKLTAAGLAHFEDYSGACTLDLKNNRPRE